MKSFDFPNLFHAVIGHLLPPTSKGTQQGPSSPPPQTLASIGPGPPTQQGVQINKNQILNILSKKKVLQLRRKKEYINNKTCVSIIQQEGWMTRTHGAKFNGFLRKKTMVNQSSFQSKRSSQKLSNCNPSLIQICSVTCTNKSINTVLNSMMMNHQRSKKGLPSLQDRDFTFKDNCKDQEDNENNMKSMLQNKMRNNLKQKNKMRNSIDRLRKTQNNDVSTHNIDDEFENAKSKSKKVLFQKNERVSICSNQRSNLVLPNNLSTGKKPISNFRKQNKQSDSQKSQDISLYLQQQASICTNRSHQSSKSRKKFNRSNVINFKIAYRKQTDILTEKYMEQAPKEEKPYVTEKELIQTPQVNQIINDQVVRSKSKKKLIFLDDIENLKLNSKERGAKPAGSHFTIRSELSQKHLNSYNYERGLRKKKSIIYDKTPNKKSTKNLHKSNKGLTQMDSTFQELDAFHRYLEYKGFTQEETVKQEPKMQPVILQEGVTEGKQKINNKYGAMMKNENRLIDMGLRLGKVVLRSSLGQKKL